MANPTFLSRPFLESWRQVPSNPRSRHNGKFIVSRIVEGYDLTSKSSQSEIHLALGAIPIDLRV